MQILLVEDDLSLADGLQNALRREGFAVNHVARGRLALQACHTDTPDIVILDLGLPDMDGLDVLRQLPGTDCKPLVLVLTARDTTMDKVTGLDRGADDYMAKPFEMPELLARLRALERRISSARSSEITIGAVTLDMRTHHVSVDGRPVELPRREFMLLKTLMENPGRIQSRQSLEARLYSWGEEISSNSIEVHVHHLRRKIAPDFIKTVRGVGYTVGKP
jgi:two-component system, OmpR family, response regulator QseB